jgi:Fe-S cluster assembly protein SufD
MSAREAALAEARDTRLDAYRAAFERFRTQPEFGAAVWLRERRARSLEAFLRRGFPTTSDEAWRTTSVAPIARASFRRADDALLARVPAALVERLGFAGAFRGREIVFVNGRLAPALSSLEALAGVRVRSLRDALQAEPERLEARLGALVPALDAHPFAALNTALFEDGALIEIEAGSVAVEPIHLLHVSLPGEGDEPTLAHPRTLVLAGRDSRTRLVSTYGGQPGERAMTNAVVEVALADGARVDHTRLQRESESAFHVALVAVRQGRDARYVEHAINVGAALARTDVDVVLAGEGAECVLDGLFLGGGAQHMDTHTRIDHAVPHGTSRELYKGVLDGRARGVFHGLIVVREGAQKSDAWQANRNLLLSPEALVNSTPQLEIRADDVKCKHGSTTGQLDPQALFYLRSRGIGEEAARALLTYAFASEIVQRIEVEPVRGRLTQYLYERLPRAPREEGA